LYQLTLVQLKIDLLAQLVSESVEHLPFKQGVLGSSPRGVIDIYIMECKNIKCKKEFDAPKKVEVDMGFMKIIQSQCPECGCPVDTKFEETGTLVYTSDKFKVE
jgi:hypothetical protein